LSLDTNSASPYASIAHPKHCQNFDIQSPLQATARRMRESEEVADRVVHVTTVAELEEQISAAGDKLLVIEVASDELCQLDSEHSLSPAECAKMKHSFQRTARDCPDAMFLEVGPCTNCIMFAKNNAYLNAHECNMIQTKRKMTFVVHMNRIPAIISGFG
jgi:hypothetical protein